MTKKGLVMLVLVIFVAEWSFAQMDSETIPENTVFGIMPKNSITVDFGPTLYGLFVAGMGNIIGEESLSTAGFGIAAQYERQILEKLSVAGRFAYLGLGMGLAEESDGLKAVLEMKFSSFSLEGHIRFYPVRETFFLDGMLGYANMSTTFSGEDIVTEYGKEKKESVSFSASINYFTLGAKLGWRIDFGKQGGFVFEPSFGYYGGIGIGDTIGKKLANDVGEDMSEFDEVFTILENIILIGGPRLSLAFGWRF